MNNQEGALRRNTVLEAQDDGARLVMIDGTSYLINPGDIPTAILWLPTTEVEISRSSDKMFESRIKNLENGEIILAMNQGIES